MTNFTQICETFLEPFVIIFGREIKGVYSKTTNQVHLSEFGDTVCQSGMKLSAVQDAFSQTTESRSKQRQ